MKYVCPVCGAALEAFVVRPLLIHAYLGEDGRILGVESSWEASAVRLRCTYNPGHGVGDGFSLHSVAADALLMAGF